MALVTKGGYGSHGPIHPLFPPEVETGLGGARVIVIYSFVIFGSLAGFLIGRFL